MEGGIIGIIGDKSATVVKAQTKFIGIVCETVSESPHNALYTAYLPPFSRFYPLLLAVVKRLCYNIRMKQRILIVEDEVKYARVLQLELENEGYGVAVKHDGEDGLKTALDGDFDLILLDLMLPRRSGLEILKAVREVKNVPVIILSARDQVMDKVKGHDGGADYYLTKPCAIEELLACIRNLLKRKAGGEAVIIKCGPVEINLNEHTAFCNGTAVTLTKKEYDLLAFLARNKNTVISREKILNSVWEYDFYGDTNIVDVYIRYLRGKLDDKFGVKLIETMRGAGYIIRE